MADLKKGPKTYSLAYFFFFCHEDLLIFQDFCYSGGVSDPSLERQLKKYRLSFKEYERICGLLTRPPQGVEWAVFSSLWSEHCSYKTSKVHLKKFKTSSQKVIESMGENAGVVDIEDGEKVAFKMESHNHPSFISPYEGASTGVGGILRDIFTMGARPIALSNYLCFGQGPSTKLRNHLVRGVVKGIGDYGNCVGVAMLTGQTEFHASYNNNILVNAMAVGLFNKDDRISLSKVQSVGALVVYVGAKTGRDGIHGASMASESFDTKEDATDKKPTVQIGDPFLEKLLLEGCREVIQKGLVVALQDMGAAGLTSSSFEMSAKGGLGLELILDKVPLRDKTLQPEDILLSESQERMLLICQKENFPKVERIFKKWDLDVAVIGQVTSQDTVDMFWHKEKIASLKAYDVVEKAPVLKRPYDKWKPKNRVDKKTVYETKDLFKELAFLFSNLQGCSRKWLYRQYDQRVGGRTAKDCSESVGVLSLRDDKFLGLCLGCRPYLMNFDAYEGAKDALMAPALELSAKGFEPLSATDCLNFGNPEDRNVMTEFVASVDALAEVSQALGIPIVSGNVSFYNETSGSHIISTPSIGVLGLKKGSRRLLSSHFVKAGSLIFLTRLPMGLWTSGLWQDLKAQKMVGQGFLKPSSEMFSEAKGAAQNNFVLSSRVVKKGGLSYSLCVMSFREKLGFQVKKGGVIKQRQDWLTESCYDILWEVEKGFEKEFQSCFKRASVYRIGEVLEKPQALFEDERPVDLRELERMHQTTWSEEIS